MEEFKKIDEYDGYEVSNLGKIRNIQTKRVLKTFINHGGYEIIGLPNKNGRKKFLVHRLVLSMFTENKQYLQVNHINHIRHDNRLENLEWVDIQENNDKRREREYITKVQITNLFNHKNFKNIEEFYNGIMKL